MSITYKELKGPKGLPIIGSIHKVELDSLHIQLENWADEFGGVYKLVLGPSKFSIITDPDIAQEILKDRPHRYRRMTKMDDVLTESGLNGVFNAEGEKWKSHRRIVTKGLDVRHQERFYPEIMISLERLLNKWNKVASQSEYDIQQDLLRFTVDVTTSLAFGYKMNTLEEDGDVIQDHLEKIFPTIFKRINSPIPIWRYLKSKSDKVFDKAATEINKFIDELILIGKERLIAQPELKENPRNFLESLLIAAEEEEDVSDDDVRGNLLTILMAGEDTTAHTLAWTMYLLADQPEVQEKLHQEANSILGENSWLTNYKEHSSLIYTEAVAIETMRLKPVAPLLLFEPLEDVEVNGYLFEKGAKLMIETRYSAIQEENFVNPTEFTPERWMKEEKGKCPMGHDTRAYIPFGAGARFCPGKNLAMLEMKLVLSMLMKNFKLEMVTPKEDVKEIMAFTMMPSAFKVRLVKRN
tara:strand:+ start:2081 stop:3481 length:1401 start_codon:yes stop_codon:yes gene_type:complete